MRNKYYINRSNKNTTNIKKAVSNMNRDINYLSNYCDKLEEIIDLLLNFIKQQFNEEVVNKTFNMSSDELIDFIKSSFI